MSRIHQINEQLEELEKNLKDADYILKVGIRQKIKDLKTEYYKISEAL